MKKSFLLFAAIVMILSFSTNVMAQDVATKATVAATPAGAVLVKAMTLAQTSPMHFGSIVLKSNLGGTVVLPSDGIEREFDGDLNTSGANPLPTNAAYNVTGTINETYALTLQPTTIVTHTTLTSGVYTMDITLMTARFTNTPGADAVESTLDASGNDSFTLGGTLTVKANQLGGIYAGTFPVSVDYN